MQVNPGVQKGNVLLARIRSDPIDRPNLRWGKEWPVNDVNHVGAHRFFVIIYLPALWAFSPILKGGYHDDAEGHRGSGAVRQELGGRGA